MLIESTAAFTDVAEAPQVLSGSTFNMWYAVRVHARAEIATATSVRARGYEVFLPLTTQRTSARPAVERPLFAGYLFCRFDYNRRQNLVTAPGVVGIVSAGRLPLPVDEAEIESIRQAVALGSVLQPRPFLKEGDKVTIDYGPLRGLHGIIARSKNQWQVVLSVSLLQRSVCVELPREYVSLCEEYVTRSGRQLLPA